VVLGVAYILTMTRQVLVITSSVISLHASQVCGLRIDKSVDSDPQRLQDPITVQQADVGKQWAADPF